MAVLLCMFTFSLCSSNCIIPPPSSVRPLAPPTSPSLGVWERLFLMSQLIYMQDTVLTLIRTSAHQHPRSLVRSSVAFSFLAHFSLICHKTSHMTSCTFYKFFFMEIILCDERTKSTVCDLGREFLFYACYDRQKWQARGCAQSTNNTPTKRSSKTTYVADRTKSS